VAGTRAGWSWLVPVVVAMPLVVVEMWFDRRSRSRRLVPELCGAMGIAAAVAAVVMAGGETARLAFGLWLVLSARAVASIPFVRIQIARLRHGNGSVAASDAAQLIGVVIAAGAVILDGRLVAGLVAVVGLAALQSRWARQAPVTAKMLGVRELLLGLAVVAITSLGVLVL
jgi:hypothetical protein